MALPQVEELFLQLPFVAGSHISVGSTALDMDHDYRDI